MSKAEEKFRQRMREISPLFPVRLFDHLCSRGFGCFFTRFWLFLHEVFDFFKVFVNTVFENRKKFSVILILMH